MPNPINSSVVIAKLLNSEGFTDYVANQVEKYWKRSAKLTPRQEAQLKRLDQELTKICSKLSEGDKRVFGKFVGLHKKMSFEVGLRIGLTAFAHKVESTK